MMYWQFLLQQALDNIEFTIQDQQLYYQYQDLMMKKLLERLGVL